MTRTNNRSDLPKNAAASPVEEAHQLEAELERSKHDLQEHLFQIENKLHQTRVRLRPTNFIGDKVFLALGISFVLGFALGYWDIPVADIGKPVARTVLTTVGRQIATRAIRG
jgi:hypothetical protein